MQEGSGGSGKAKEEFNKDRFPSINIQNEQSIKIKVKMHVRALSQTFSFWDNVI